MMKRFIACWALLFLGQHVIAQEGGAQFNQTLQKALAAKDFDAAIQLLDESQDAPLAQRVTGRMQLASILMQSNRQQEAIEQSIKGAKLAIDVARDGKLPNQNLVSAVMMATSMSRSVEGSTSSPLVSDALEIVRSKLSQTELTTDHRLVLDLLRTQFQTGQPSDQDLARSLMDKHIAKSEELFAKDSSDPAKATTMLGIWNTQIQTVDPQKGHRVYKSASEHAEKLIKESANPGLVAAYTNLASSYIGRNARNEPDLALAALDSAKSVLGEVSSEDRLVKQSVEMFLKNSQNMERTIQGAKRLLSMIGQPAPEIDPMEWVNGEPLSKLSDLKGRVVLIDFWAVWCGPCIATFPHLKHLDQEYSDKGLTILGVTRQYNMKWDEAKDNYVRGDSPVELEEEMGMLEKFIAKHQLTHRTMVTPEKSEMQSQYAVTGIPHAVLIDKQGLVRLVKVGSGSQNAEEIESTIKKLLAE
jgi:thiol-disulfide isomerase/thioredoxin